MSDFATQKQEEAESLRDEESTHWFDVMRTFLSYSDFVEMEIHRRQRHINALNKFQVSKLPDLTYERINEAQQGLQRNSDVFENIVAFYQETTQDWNNRNGKDPYGRLTRDRVLPDPQDGPAIPLRQQHRCDAVLHSLSREWSCLGAEERKLTFDPIIEELARRLPVLEDGSNAYTQRILVPGCGVARLPIEIAARGYCVEGNEFSAYMLMASNYILNGVFEAGQLSINPSVDKVCNILRVADVFEPVAVPDRAAADILRDSPWFDNGNDENLPYPRFSMSAGDFCELYGPSAVPPTSTDIGGDGGAPPGTDTSTSISKMNTFDAVVTCFFIDTAPVIIDYLQTLQHCLRPGGLWVNFGPLLYHWMSDSEGSGDPRYDSSIELSWDELRLVIEDMGFELLQHSSYDATAQSDEYIDDGLVRLCSVPYTKAKGSLMWTQYNALFFTAVKK